MLLLCLFFLVDYGTDIEKDEEVVTTMINSMALSQLSVGIGTMTELGYDCEWDYGWTEDALEEFVDWMEEQGVLEVDVWPCTIDSSSANGTAEYYFDVLSQFLLYE